ncbi:MAG: ABC transporter substrate-binding protein [Candidatus Gracilibacteria bacterium]|nr:ABC transporter substrate-binding protein [Candidatus Gracilibacteria bacterium]
MRRLLGFIIIITLAFVVLTSEPEDIRQTDTESTGPQVLRLWGVYDLPEVYDPIIQSFQKKYPNSEVEYKQFSNFQEYDSILRQQLERGKGPDVLLFQDHDREYYKQHLLATNAEAANGFADFVQQDLVDNGLLYGLPLWADTLVLYYNKNYYPEGIQKNWHGFAKQTAEISIPGMAMGRLDNLHSAWDIIRALFVQKNVILSGKTSNEAYDALEFFLRFGYPIDEYYNWSSNLGDKYPEKERESFARKKVAAIAGFSPVYDQIGFMGEDLRNQNLRHTKKADIGVASFPQFSEEKPKYLGKYVAVGVSLYSKSPNLAWEFIKNMTSQDNAEYFSAATGRIPGRTIPAKESDSELQRIQKSQIQHVHTFHILPDQISALIPFFEKALKDRSLLREIMELSW